MLTKDNRNVSDLFLKFLNELDIHKIANVYTISYLYKKPIETTRSFWEWFFK
jgi:hypothetical protein